MSGFSDYTTLQATITRWAWRTGDAEFEASVPDFIALNEARLNDALRVRDQEKQATIALTDGAGALPSDYLEFRDVIRDGNPAVVLSAVAPSYGDSQNPFGDGGDPVYFTIEGDTIRTFPRGNGNIILSYYARIPALSIAEPTNWLLARKPELYLYGSLIEAAPFMEEDARLQTWTTLYDKALQDLMNADVRSRYARATRRTRSPTP